MGIPRLTHNARRMRRNRLSTTRTSANPIAPLFNMIASRSDRACVWSCQTVNAIPSGSQASARST